MPKEALKRLLFGFSSYFSKSYLTPNKAEQNLTQLI